MDIIVVSEKWNFRLFKGLKISHEWQDDGTGVVHQVAQFPIDQVGLYI